MAQASQPMAAYLDHCNVRPTAGATFSSGEQPVFSQAISSEGHHQRCA